MENENKETIIDSEETNEKVEETVETEETTEEKPEEEKPKETPKAKKARLERQLKKVNKELGVEDKPKEDIKKSDELDYGQLAFMEAKGIKEEEQEFVEGELKKSNLELKDLFKNEYFQSNLKKFRDNNEAKNATPKNNKRSGVVLKDSLEYHIANKTPVGDIEDVKLRREVLNARIDTEKNSNKFTDVPVIS